MYSCYVFNVSPVCEFICLVIFAIYMFLLKKTMSLHFWKSGSVCLKKCFRNRSVFHRKIILCDQHQVTSSPLIFKTACEKNLLPCSMITNYAITLISMNSFPNIKVAQDKLTPLKNAFSFISITHFSMLIC